MAKLEHWIIAARKVEAVDQAVLDAIVPLGAVAGGGWNDTHQHICVNQYNKEDLEALLEDAGCTVSYVSEKSTLHPELHPNPIRYGYHDCPPPENTECLIVSRMLAVLDPETVSAILEAGGQIGGGWCEVHRHVHVDSRNREEVAAILRAAGLTVTACPWEMIPAAIEAEP